MLFHVLRVYQTDPTFSHIQAWARCLKHNLNLTAFTILNNSKPIITRHIQYPNVARIKSHGPKENFRGIMTLRHITEGYHTSSKTKCFFGNRNFERVMSNQTSTESESHPSIITPIWRQPYAY
jgi:hypothetical protein